MAKFDPFKNLNCRYGAPMGRHGHNADSWDGYGKLYARHCGGDGYYDKGGAYWGHSRVFAVWTRGGVWCAYVEASSKESAINKVKTLCATEE
jgi:hypothetical protein